jgi:uncharacterized protein YciI
MILYAVRNERGPAWDWSRSMREQDRWNDHAAFMDALADERFIVAGGPIGEGKDEGALHIVQAESPAAGRSRLAADPWVTMGLLRVGSIEPWVILLGKLG